MITWLIKVTGLQPIVVKIIIVAVGSMGILYALRMWGNAQWAKGEQQGRSTAINYIEKKQLEEWKIQKEQIETDKKQNAIDKKSLIDDRATLQKTLSEALNKFNKQKVVNHETANNIPYTDLVPAIRILSRSISETE